MITMIDHVVKGHHPLRPFQPLDSNSRCQTDAVWLGLGFKSTCIGLGKSTNL